MDRKTLIVASSEGFIIKGLEAKLQGIGVAASFVTPTVKELDGRCDGTGLIIIYADESIGLVADALVYLKDYCSEKDEQMIVIGTREEYETLTGYIPSDLIYKFYERPLDMEVLINDVSRYMEDEFQLARRKSILIVDDDVSYMRMIMDWLKDGYRVTMANSGMQAITWLAKNHADLILLDYEMPVTPGPKVLEMIRSDADLSNIPVMFLTGRGDKESIMKVLSLKPVGYLLKTVERAELRENIRKFFTTQKS